MNKRFDIEVLYRDEFIIKIANYLNTKCKIQIGDREFKGPLSFYRGIIRTARVQLPVAIVGYGGSGKNLRDLPTPLQTELLSSIFEIWEDISKGNSLVPLLILGHSFDEVFLRKIYLFRAAIKDIRLIQYINVRNAKYYEKRRQRINNNFSNLEKKKRIEDESKDLQSAVVDYLVSEKELGRCGYDIIDIEVPAGEGTKKSEKIDILACERKRRWLTVIELKYEKITNRRLQSSIFQGLDYCRWVEEHKKSLAMLYPKIKIDTRRRTRLILINGPEKFPPFHDKFIKSCKERDRYQEIELYYTNDAVPISITPICA